MTETLDGTLHSAGGGHRQDESREQRVESAHQHSAGSHVRRFEHGRHEAAVEAHRVRRQRGGLDQVLTEGESVPWRHRPQVQRVVEDRGGSRSESQPRRSRSWRRPARRAALLRPHNAPEGSGHGQGRTRGRELRTPTLAKAHSGVTKTMAKLPRRTSIIFGGDFNGDPLPDDAAIGWYHPCESPTDNGAHVSEVCRAAHLWSPSTWAARPVPPNPCWEGNNVARTQGGTKQTRSHSTLDRPRISASYG